MRSLDLTRKSRKVACVATLTAAGLSFGLIACGGDQGGSDATAATGGTTGALSADGQATGTPPEGAPGPPVQLTAKQEECLAGEGVSLPSEDQTSNAMPDPEEIQAAFEACDIEAPEPPSDGGPSSSGPPTEGGSGAASTIPSQAS